MRRDSSVDDSGVVLSPTKHEGNDLEVRARELFPKNESYQKRWVEAALWLRSQNKWINDPGTPAPDWAKGVERLAA